MFRMFSNSLGQANMFQIIYITNQLIYIVNQLISIANRFTLLTN